MADEKILKEIYQESMDRVKTIRNTLGHNLEKEKENPLLSETSFHYIANLMNSLVGALQYEQKNNYSEVMCEVAVWANACFQTPDYFVVNKSAKPQPLFVFSKALDLLYNYLQRDRRRKVLTRTEVQLKEEFFKLVSQLPDPRKEKLSQQDIDLEIELILKSS